MKHKTRSFIFSLLFAPCALIAYSITLINDTEYDLTAVIRGKKGVLIEEVSIPKYQTQNWIYDKKLLPDLEGQSIKDLTPFTVSWMCLGGKVFGVYPNVFPGMQISAKESPGAHFCEPKKDPPDIFP